MYRMIVMLKMLILWRTAHIL